MRRTGDQQLISNQREIWSGRGDLNARPPAPKAAQGVFFTPIFSATSPMLSIRYREIIVSLNVPEYPWFSSGVPKEIPMVKRHQSNVFRVA
jgi:hypothetical protein